MRVKETYGQKVRCDKVTFTVSITTHAETPKEVLETVVGKGKGVIASLELLGFSNDELTSSIDRVSEHYKTVTKQDVSKHVVGKKIEGTATSEQVRDGYVCTARIYISSFISAHDYGKLYEVLVRHNVSSIAYNFFLSEELRDKVMGEIRGKLLEKAKTTANQIHPQEYVVENFWYNCSPDGNSHGDYREHGGFMKTAEASRMGSDDGNIITEELSDAISYLISEAMAPDRYIEDSLYVDFSV